MTNEQINIAIAEFTRTSEIADCCNDLNAMHEAEKVAFGGTDLWQEFVFCLIETSGGGGVSELDCLCCLVQATARQRAEAFLRTIGKWEEIEKTL